MKLNVIQKIKKGTRKHYQHINSGQSRNDVELNQKPAFINQPYYTHYQKINQMSFCPKTTSQQSTKGMHTPNSYMYAQAGMNKINVYLRSISI